MKQSVEEGILVIGHFARKVMHEREQVVFTANDEVNAISSFYVQLEL